MNTSAINACAMLNLPAPCNDLELTTANLNELLDSSAPFLDDTQSYSTLNHLNPLKLLDNTATAQTQITNIINDSSAANTMLGKLQLQQSISEFSVNASLLSKVIGITIKNIDTLVKIQ